MKEKIYVKYKELEKNKYYYIDFGSEDHGKPSFRLWISNKLIKTEENKEYIELPISNISIKKTEKGTIVLKQGNENLFKIFIPCGYRGGASYELLTQITEEYKFYIYHSPKGNLGVDTGALLTTNLNYVKYKWNRTGRTYGEAKEGISIIYLDGKTENIDDIGEIDEIKEINE